MQVYLLLLHSSVMVMVLLDIIPNVYFFGRVNLRPLPAAAERLRIGAFICLSIGWLSRVVLTPPWISFSAWCENLNRILKLLHKCFVKWNFCVQPSSPFAFSSLKGWSHNLFLSQILTRAWGFEWQCHLGNSLAWECIFSSNAPQK